ncbi:MAG: RecQ family ATP-dependent DNA helicase, partial [Oscillospiraceae bacterium]
MHSIVFIDSEISANGEISDLGAVKPNGETLHTSLQGTFSKFVSGNEFVCGHNIFEHDLKYINHLILGDYKVIDTLCLSPLLFPTRPYHHLLKDYKLYSDDINNPASDAALCMELFFDEIAAFNKLDETMRRLFFLLLGEKREFSSFFDYADYWCGGDAESIIRDCFEGKICSNANLDELINNYPIELAYCLSLINTDDRYSIIPHWVHRNYPVVESVMRKLRSISCNNCEYCNNAHSLLPNLKRYFGYNGFRSYDGEPLQEKAAKAAVDNKSLIAVFPTGGGKSVTFQLPALMAGESCRGLTVVISPLQSLMKDQVDNLISKGISDAVTINGLLDPIERKQAIENVQSGLASILYISPESLRSRTIEKLLLDRQISRFVIDEAHCFSAWGQDFRVDYLYIGEFIKELQQKKNLKEPIPVSCFTATAKQKVISDIRDYFRSKLGIEMELFATGVSRKNLRYEVLHMDNDNAKYIALRNLIESKKVPTIVYVSKVKRTLELAQHLSRDGFLALPYNGKMDINEKIENQERFMNGEVSIIVATSAFGMGVDKSDVGLVVHYDISPSLEDYVQEAGRAGRDESINAECYVLFNDGDLDGHFVMLNQTKLSIKEINQIWGAIKYFSHRRPVFTRSALEIARQAGWSDEQSDIETRVRNAINALETAGYVKRGKNVPRVYASGINAKNFSEAQQKITSMSKLDNKQKEYACRIIRSMIAKRSRSVPGNDEAESRVDYISDTLGIPIEEVVNCINIMREYKLLADSNDLTAYISKDDTHNKSLRILGKYSQLESFLLDTINPEIENYSLKELNENAIQNGINKSSVRDINTILHYWTIKEFIRKPHEYDENSLYIVPTDDIAKLKNNYRKRITVAETVLRCLYEEAFQAENYDKKGILIEFSVLQLVEYCRTSSLYKPEMCDVEDALLYLSKIGAISIEGGFLVLYNGMEITRLELKNSIRYKKEDYAQLDEFYKHKIQQIHIVGEYANMMSRDYNSALQFVSDYFSIDYKQFINKYFAQRSSEIERNITPERFDRLFRALSDRQMQIIRDDESKNIVVCAGPGSGKTMLLVHKLASLYQMEDIKHEQLLMLTFSRAAASEFRTRLMELMNGAVRYMDIKTFHSYCFDIAGRVGNLDGSANIIKEAIEKIRNGDIEQGKITKTVLVIDEAQDMDCDEFELVRTLMEKNEDMRVIAVGDDDQNIYEFRNSSSEYMKSLITQYNAVQYSMVDNYRSCQSIVNIANEYARRIPNRLKHEPIHGVKAEMGVVEIVKHSGKNLDIPVADCLQKTWNSENGTAAILTSTNDEALRMLGVLSERNIPAKLIQSNSGFRLSQLAEVKYFCKMLNSEQDSPTISKSEWEGAKDALKSYYEGSTCLETVLNMLEEYERLNTEKMYRTDFKMFIYESNYDTFCKSTK